jgi:hypothetical protein
MIKKYITLILLIASVSQFAGAQDKDKKIRLQSISTIGLLNGGKGASVALQTIIGGAIHHSFLGAGIALDYYRFRSVPVFIDVRQEFGQGEKNVFLYGDIGYNVDWVTDKNKQDANVYSLTSNYKGGLYYDAGIGYKVGFKKSDALVISIGYTFKKIINEAGVGACPFFGPCGDDIQTYKYYLSRMVIKAGWRF